MPLCCWPGTCPVYSSMALNIAWHIAARQLQPVAIFSLEMSRQSLLVRALCAAASIAAHPITALWRAGVSLSFHTDNRLLSGITHSSEARVLMQDTPLTIADLLHMGLQAARHSFLDSAIRDQARSRLLHWAAEAGVPLPSAPL